MGVWRGKGDGLSEVLGWKRARTYFFVPLEGVCGNIVLYGMCFKVVDEGGKDGFEVLPLLLFGRHCACSGAFQKDRRLRTKLGRHFWIG